ISIEYRYGGVGRVALPGRMPCGRGAAGRLNPCRLNRAAPAWQIVTRPRAKCRSIPIPYAAGAAGAFWATLLFPPPIRTFYFSLLVFFFQNFHCFFFLLYFLSTPPGTLYSSFACSPY